MGPQQGPHGQKILGAPPQDLIQSAFSLQNVGLRPPFGHGWNRDKWPRAQFIQIRNPTHGSKSWIASVMMMMSLDGQSKLAARDKSNQAIDLLGRKSLLTVFPVSVFMNICMPPPPAGSCRGASLATTAGGVSMTSSFATKDKRTEFQSSSVVTSEASCSQSFHPINICRMTRSGN